MDRSTLSALLTRAEASTRSVRIKLMADSIDHLRYLLAYKESVIEFRKFAGRISAAHHNRKWDGLPKREIVFQLGPEFSQRKEAFVQTLAPYIEWAVINDE